MPATQRDPVRTLVPAVGLLLVLGLAVVLGLASTAAPTATDQPPVDAGATAWMLTSTALVLLMVPGLAMFYGGLVRTKNVLGTMMHSFAAMAVIGVLWAVWAGVTYVMLSQIFQGQYIMNQTHSMRGVTTLKSVQTRTAAVGEIDIETSFCHRKR